jgi:hypothetical protein
MRNYEAAEFVSLLASNRLEEPMDLALYGLVKADEKDGSVLLFSFSSACEQWMPIPASLISSIRHIRNVSCKDHKHPFVRIELAEPKKEDVSAVLFKRLFAEVRTRTTAARMKALGGRRALMRAGCEVFDFDGELSICCPPDGGAGSWTCTGMV